MYSAITEGAKIPAALLVHQCERQYGKATKKKKDDHRVHQKLMPLMETKYLGVIPSRLD